MQEKERETMEKRTVQKDDGRLLIFYTFKKATPDETKQGADQA